MDYRPRLLAESLGIGSHHDDIECMTCRLCILLYSRGHIVRDSVEHACLEFPGIPQCHKVSIQDRSHQHRIGCALDAILQVCEDFLSDHLASLQV